MVPGLFAFRLHSRKAIERRLDGADQRPQQRTFTGIDPRQIAAEGACQKTNDGDEKPDLQPAACRHGPPSSSAGRASRRSQRFA